MSTKSSMPRGVAILRTPLLNKGTAFTEAERDALGLRGLLPPTVTTMDEQLLRVMTNLRSKPSDIEKYLYLQGLQDRNETLFYRALGDHLEELMPIVYTPTVGRGCQEFGKSFRRPRGVYVSIKDKGRVREILSNWEGDDVQVVLPTDGERILGLGDLGANGMGIPIGKLALYTVCAGIHPAKCLPVLLDVGTENETLLSDPLYLGLKQRRVRGAEYDAFVAEFMEACKERWPRALVQFEDFANQNAFRLLEQWRHEVCSFNDDIQGTGSVALAGVLSSLRVTGRELSESTILFFGAGEAATGIGEMIVATMVRDGLPEKEARKRCWFVDSKGLVVASRTDLVHHKKPWAHDAAPVADLATAIDVLKPHCLIGASGNAGAFTPEIIASMAKYNERPVVFALSNPTSKAECTAEAAYLHSEGRALFASGSPFAPVTFKGRTYVSGQGNNAYIFPGVGLGVVASGAREITDGMFLAASRTIASLVRDSELESGSLYPSLTRLREVSRAIALEVARMAFDEGIATYERPADLDAWISGFVYVPEYPNFA